MGGASYSPPPVSGRFRGFGGIGGFGRLCGNRHRLFGVHGAAHFVGPLGVHKLGIVQCRPPSVASLPDSRQMVTLVRLLQLKRSLSSRPSWRGSITACHNRAEGFS